MDLTKLFIWLVRYLEIILIVLNLILVAVILLEWKEYKSLLHRRKLIRDLLSDTHTNQLSIT